MISLSFAELFVSAFILLYNNLDRPKYALQAFSPRRITGARLLERIDRRLQYDERQLRLGIHSIRWCHLRGILLVVRKPLKGALHLELGLTQSCNTRSTRFEGSLKVGGAFAESPS